MENTDKEATNRVTPETEPADTATAPGLEELAFMFRHTARLMMRGRERGPFSHPGQGRVLLLLRERGPLNRRVLMDMLGVRSGSLSELLAKLERQNLITKNRDDNDRRGFIVAATEKGNSMMETVETTSEERPEAIFACLTEEERAQLGLILAKLIANGDDAQYMTEDGPGHHGRCRHGMGRDFGHGGRGRGFGHGGRGRGFGRGRGHE